MRSTHRGPKRQSLRTAIKGEPARVKHPAFPVGKDFLRIFPEARLAYLAAIEPDRTKGGRPRKEVAT